MPLSPIFPRTPQQTLKPPSDVGAIHVPFAGDTPHAGGQLLVSSCRGVISPPPAPQHPALAPGLGAPGGCGRWVGSGGGRQPRGGRDSLGQTADTGAEVSQAGWLPEPDIFGKFQQKQFRSFQKAARWEKALFCLSPALFFYWVFNLCGPFGWCQHLRALRWLPRSVPTWPQDSDPPGALGQGLTHSVTPLGGASWVTEVSLPPWLCPSALHALQGVMSLSL